jgi:hypothetical protein
MYLKNNTISAVEFANDNKVIITEHSKQSKVYLNHKLLGLVTFNVIDKKIDCEQIKALVRTCKNFRLFPQCFKFPRILVIEYSDASSVNNLFSVSEGDLISFREHNNIIQFQHKNRSDLIGTIINKIEKNLLSQITDCFGRWQFGVIDVPVIKKVVS